MHARKASMDMSKVRERATARAAERTGALQARQVKSTIQLAEAPLT